MDGSSQSGHRPVRWVPLHPARRKFSGVHVGIQACHGFISTDGQKRRRERRRSVIVIAVTALTIGGGLLYEWRRGKVIVAILASLPAGSRLRERRRDGSEWEVTMASGADLAPRAEEAPTARGEVPPEDRAGPGRPGAGGRHRATRRGRVAPL
ncbi:hypothetical protein FAGKG844_10145 [Frankia sp. AgKG'84/4]